MVLEKYEEKDHEFNVICKQVKEKKEAFEKIKKERWNRFMNCFKHVSEEIDGIYKVRKGNRSYVC